jgi:hypothetical protein
MKYQHVEMAAGRWNKFSFFEQMANIGIEVERTISWNAKGRKDYSRRAFDRALELLDLTIGDEKNRSRLRELLRVREAAVDYFICDNEYNSSAESWKRYFNSFLTAARKDR